MFAESMNLISGLRVALVSNSTGRLRDGTHLADALDRSPEVDLRMLFGMAHPIRTCDYSLPRDLDGADDIETGVPKFNLYGARHKPEPWMLADLDVIVFDVQEVGARFYEHVNIMGFIMEAAAEQGIGVVVLDRPNPVRGTSPSGFLPDRDAFFGFGSYAPIPALHGMTVGELAGYYNGERLLRGERSVDLTVVPVRNWRRDMWFDDTGLPWNQPSPNLPSPDSALAYGATCLFEAFNVSEGRGTATPFEVIGSPWLDNDRVCSDLNDRQLAGVHFEVARFEPAKLAFHASPPKFTGNALPGVRMVIDDRDRFEPYSTGLAMLWTVHQRHREELEWDRSTLRRLAATERLEQMLLEDTDLGLVVESWSQELADFQESARPYLIYPSTVQGQ